MDQSITYTVSLYPSRFLGHNRKKKEWGEIKIYLPPMWEYCSQKFDSFVKGLNYIILLERVCLERGFQRIRMKHRCKPICKLEEIVDIMLYLDDVLASRREKG